MIYTLAQLKEMIIPMLQSMDDNVEAVADALVRIIEEDRHATADEIDKALKNLKAAKEAADAKTKH